jgi:cytochrome c biogenesis protein CcmG/thiol:disulfide interchange protein DsbE
MGMRRFILWAPLTLFALFALLFAGGLLKPSTSTIRSHLVGQKLPEFALPEAQPGRPSVSSAGMKQGGPRLLNIFASWCVPCAAEAPQLAQLKQAGVRIDAIAIRDRPEDIARFLQRYGDPYAAIGSDKDSSVQLALGSSGVPETFVIDSNGVIRHQHIGDIRPEDVPSLISAVQQAGQ